MVYEPQEDSYLLQEQVKKHAFGRVLDMGTGSGIQAVTASKKTRVSRVLAVDIDKESVAFCKSKYKTKKIRFKTSDLFQNVRGKFDTITFNPPYLPQDKGIQDPALYGGKKGYELIRSFLSGASSHLKPDGIILLLFSSHTNKEKVEKFIKNNLFKFEQLSTHHQFFEDLFVYKLIKSPLLKKLEKKGIKNIHYFDEGKRGVIFKGIYKNTPVAIKTKKIASEAIQRIPNEIYWLKQLNKINIGPKLLFHNKTYFVYKFVDGPFILDFLKTAGKPLALKIILNCLDQCYKLDKLHVDKEEMHHPVKHIIIQNNKPVFIDFERTHKVMKPQNVTQFVQFISKLSEVSNLKINILKLREYSKEYKQRPSKESFLRIKRLIR